eukprot:9075515-Pyramimonas_sp.AAC.1
MYIQPPPSGTGQAPSTAERPERSARSRPWLDPESLGSCLRSKKAPTEGSRRVDQRRLRRG